MTCPRPINCYLESEFENKDDALHAKASKLGQEFEKDLPVQIRLVTGRYRKLYCFTQIIEEPLCHDVAIYTNDHFSPALYITLDNKEIGTPETPKPLIDRMLDMI